MTVEKAAIETLLEKKEIYPKARGYGLNHGDIRRRNVDSRHAKGPKEQREKKLYEKLSRVRQRNNQSVGDFISHLNSLDCATKAKLKDEGKEWEIKSISLHRTFHTYCQSAKSNLPIGRCGTTRYQRKGTFCAILYNG